MTTSSAASLHLRRISMALAAVVDRLSNGVEPFEFGFELIDLHKPLIQFGKKTRRAASTDEELFDIMRRSNFYYSG